MRRPCLVSGCSAFTFGSRCSTHEAQHQSARNRARPHYQGRWPVLSRAARRAQPWCSDCGSTVDLTTDHVTPRSLEGGVEVLCRSCNAKRRWARR